MAHFEALCCGNTYATTLHALNSALVKLAKLASCGVASASMSCGSWETL